MGLARWAGRPLVLRLVNARLLERLDRLAAGRGLWFFLVVFLLPGLPDDAACFLAGLTPLPLPALIAAAAVGRIPGIAGAVWAGAHAGKLPWQGWVILGGLALAAAVVAWRYGERMQGALSEMARPRPLNILRCDAVRPWHPVKHKRRGGWYPRRLCAKEEEESDAILVSRAQNAGDPDYDSSKIVQANFLARRPVNPSAGRLTAASTCAGQ